jgi:hypothetical protein
VSTWDYVSRVWAGLGGRGGCRNRPLWATERGSGNGELNDELKVDMCDVPPSAMLFDWFVLME